MLLHTIKHLQHPIQCGVWGWGSRGQNLMGEESRKIVSPRGPKAGPLVLPACHPGQDGDVLEAEERGTEQFLDPSSCFEGGSG